MKLAALKVGGSPGGAWHNKDLAGTMAPVSCLKADPSSLFQKGSNTALETERILFLGHTWFCIVLWDMTLNVYQTMSWVPLLLNVRFYQGLVADSICRHQITLITERTISGMKGRTFKSWNAKSDCKQNPQVICRTVNRVVSTKTTPLTHSSLSYLIFIGN